MSNEVKRAIVQLRRNLHKHPELGWQETQTTAKVGASLKALGIQHKSSVASTGVVAELAREASLPVSVQLTFQPAEETGRGAKAMIEKGVLDGVGEFDRLAVHLQARNQGIGRELMKGRIERAQQRLHLGLVENRVVHPFSQKISAAQDFYCTGLLSLKLLTDQRKSVALYDRFLWRWAEAAQKLPARDLRGSRVGRVGDGQLGLGAGRHCRYWFCSATWPETLPVNSSKATFCTSNTL